MKEGTGEKRVPTSLVALYCARNAPLATLARREWYDFRKDKNKIRGQATSCGNTFSFIASVTTRYARATGPVKSMTVQPIITAAQIWS